MLNIGDGMAVLHSLNVGKISHMHQVARGFVDNVPKPNEHVLVSADSYYDVSGFTTLLSPHTLARAHTHSDATANFDIIVVLITHVSSLLQSLSLACRGRYMVVRADMFFSLTS